MKHKIVLHIGAHKTGSTALQAALQNHSDMLIGNDIVTMPRRLSAEMFVHEMLLEAREVIADINAETLIITHEVILGWPFGPIGKLMPTHPFLYPEAKQRLDALACIFEGFDVGIVYYIRDQASFLESFYIQCIQGGATFSFDEWIAKIDLSRLSWRPIIDEIRSRFPICVKRFETEFAHSQSEAFRRFLSVATPTISREEIDSITFEEPANRSLNAVGLSMMMEINNIALLPEQRSALRAVLQRHVSNLGGGRPSLLSDKQRAILAAYQAENEALANAMSAMTSAHHARASSLRLPPKLGGPDPVILQPESRRPADQARSL
jgi:hypothetical protein